jgi:hypothetical protein
VSRKPENQFVSGVHGYLPPEADFPRWKTNNPYVAGIWDWYYAGDVDELWIEYKFIVVPKRPDTMVLPALTPLQIHFGRALHRCNRNIAVVVGCAKGAVTYRDLSWERPITASEFTKRVIPRADLARWIQAATQ